MQSFQRVVALLSLIAVSFAAVGCGGPGKPVPGGADPVTEAADGALAPEGGSESGPAPSEAVETPAVADAPADEAAEQTDSAETTTEETAPNESK